MDPKKMRSVIVSIFHWFIAKAREFQKNICLCFISKTKAFDCVYHSKLWKPLKEIGYRRSHLSPEKPVCGSKSNS